MRLKCTLNCDVSLLKINFNKKINGGFIWWGTTSIEWRTSHPPLLTPLKWYFCWYLWLLCHPWWSQTAFFQSHFNPTLPSAWWLNRHRHIHTYIQYTHMHSYTSSWIFITKVNPISQSLISTTTRTYPPFINSSPCSCYFGFVCSGNSC